MHSTLDFVWIRPVRGPPHRNDVHELSASATQVLRALQRTYQPHYAGLAAVTPHRPSFNRVPNCQLTAQQFERTQSSNRLHNVVRLLDVSHCSSPDADQPNDGVDYLGLGLGLGLGSRRLSDLSPHIDNLHLSKTHIHARIQPAAIPSSNDDCALAPASKDQNLYDDNCDIEISDIFEESYGSGKEKQNISLEKPSQFNLSPDIYEDIEFDKSSPMSMLDLPEVPEKNASSKDQIYSDLKFTEAEHSDKYDQHDYDCMGSNRIEKNEKWLTDVCTDPEIGGLDRDDIVEISMCDSISICSQITSSPKDLIAPFPGNSEKMTKSSYQPVNCQRVDRDKQEQSVQLQVFNSSRETPQRHVLTDNKNLSKKIGIANEELSCSSPVQNPPRPSSSSADFLSSIELHSQRDECNVSKNSNFLSNFDSEGIFSDLNEGYKANKNSGHKNKNSKSPDILKRNEQFGSKTPTILRKFLGNPFKRALFASNKAIEECRTNTTEQSLHKEAVSDENVQIHTSDEMIANESNKDNHAHSNITQFPTTQRNPSTGIQKYISENEKDKDSGSKLYYPIFKKSYQSKFKANMCSTSNEILEEESNKENHASANVPMFQSTERNLSPVIQKPVSENANWKDSGSKLYVPIFKPRSESAGSTVLKATKGPEPPCKRPKFAVPYKQREERKLSSNDIIQQLTENLAKEIEDRMLSTPPQETSLTLHYREGFSQLDRPKMCKAYNPEKILLRIMWTDKVQYIYVTLQSSSWCSLFLSKLFSDQSRKICFEAQEMIQLLVDTYGFNACEVSSKWLILDPLIGCWLLNPDEPPHSFKEVLALLKVTEIEGNCEGINGAQILISSLSQSAQALYENLTRIGLWKLFLHIEMRITPILACMELHGIQVNVTKLKEVAEILKFQLDSAQKAAHEAAGRPFQLTSPQQLSAILYEHLQLDTKNKIKVKETDKRHKSTSESMLIKFKDLHPLPGIVLEFRRLHKHKSTYVDAVLGHVSGDCIYATWDQISAATGRITSNEPNLQATPKQPLMPGINLRTVYTARAGYSFLAADFQQIELRVFAHLSKDNALIRVLSHTTDVFKMLAQKWLQLENITKVSDEDREKTKRIVYAVMYGAGPSKLSEFLHIDYNQACLVLQKFSSTFPKMQQFSKSVLDQCRNQGYLSTEAGRRRWFPHITSPNSQLRCYSERQAVNFLIQGTAADICKCAMVHTQKHIAATRSHKSVTEVRLLLQIHDELLWEVPDSDLLDIADVVQEAMEGATAVMQSLSSFSVSLPVVMKVGKTWGDMKTLKNASLVTASQQV